MLGQGWAAKAFRDDRAGCALMLQRIKIVVASLTSSAFKADLNSEFVQSLAFRFLSPSCKNNSRNNAAQGRIVCPYRPYALTFPPSRMITTSRFSAHWSV